MQKKLLFRFCLFSFFSFLTGYFDCLLSKKRIKIKMFQKETYCHVRMEIYSGNKQGTYSLDKLRWWLSASSPITSKRLSSSRLWVHSKMKCAVRCCKHVVVYSHDFQVVAFKILSRQTSDGIIHQHPAVQTKHQKWNTTPRIIKKHKQTNTWNKTGSLLCAVSVVFLHNVQPCFVLSVGVW